MFHHVNAISCFIANYQSQCQTLVKPLTIICVGTNNKFCKALVFRNVNRSALITLYGN